MKKPVSSHEFFAPIDGVACRFSLHCAAGVPQALFAADNGTNPKPDPFIARQLADLNELMRKGLPWAAVRTQHQGNIGAIIEAAESRRLEIYGEMGEAA